MPIVGVLHLELRLEHATSIKDKRNVIRGLKARLRARHNVAVAEIADLDSWHRGVVSAVTVANDRLFAEKVLRAVEDDAADTLGAALVSTGIEWIE